MKKRPGGSKIGIHSIRAPKKDVPTTPDIRTLLERQTFQTLRLKAEILKRTADKKKDATRERNDQPARRDADQRRRDAAARAKPAAN